MSGVYEPLTEAEAYLFAILQDSSGLDIAEFCLLDEEFPNGLVRAFDMQWPWWRDNSKYQIDQGSRSVGKSMSIRYRAIAFPFCMPGSEMLITAPEAIHLQAITDKIDTIFRKNRIPREMIATRGSQLLIGKRPFNINFKNGARIMGRIPQRDGAGVKGCVTGDTLIFTSNGFVRADELRPGDQVMTHKGVWGPVLQVVEDETECYEVTGTGSFPLTVSWDHRFYGISNLSGPKKAKKFSDPFFAEVESLEEFKFHWASPTRFPSLGTVYPSGFEGSKEFWWLVGLYLADGYVTSQEGVDGSRIRGRVNWVTHPDKADAQLVKSLEALGFNPYRIQREHSSADVLQICSVELHDWLVGYFGKGCSEKKMPAFAFSMEKEYRQALLDGYLAGDGHWNETRSRWEAGSASKALATCTQLLAQSLGYQVKCNFVQPKVNKIMGSELKKIPQISWRIQISTKGHSIFKDDIIYNRVREIKPIGKQKIYNPIIEGDHSYVTGSIISHNVHPAWLEQDEASDYPEAGWIELNSTIQKIDKAMWRAHGVTKGIGGTFDKYCQPDSGWKVHRLPAMMRPTWDDVERQENVMKYLSEDNVDYRRNVLGLPGDSSSALFVLHRLMKCVDQEESSRYNEDIYYSIKLDDAMIEEIGDPLLLLNLPASHMSYKNFWIGMDVGWTTSPSAITIFAEERDHKKEKTSLRLLTRILLTRVSGPDQVRIITHLVDMYRPLAFAMDSTGAGQPLVQFLQDEVKRNPEIRMVIDRIKGYNFSSNIVVDFDDTVEIDENKADGWKEAEIKRNVKDYSSDLLRALVDENRLMLPFDKDLIREFQGETWSYSKSVVDHYGRKKIYSGTGAHSLDACRMAALAYKQNAIDQFIKNQEDNWEPPPMIFL